ncbi:LuxR C-terminal-related transcriptional regulator [Serratia fonticola]
MINDKDCCGVIPDFSFVEGIMLGIVIKDNNAVYALGLRLCLEQALSSREQEVKYFDLADDAWRCDIIFQQIDPGTDCLLATPYIQQGFKGVFFPIVERDTNDKGHNEICECLRHFPIIFRDEPLSAVVNRVVRQLECRDRVRHVEHDSIMTKSCCVCGRPRLSSNEMKVIKLLSKEYSLTRISFVLKKSVKTVFTQKKSAMKKLNLKSNQELYSFIINNKEMIGLF